MATRVTVLGVTALLCLPLPAYAWPVVENVEAGLVSADFVADPPSSFTDFLGRGMAEQSFALQHGVVEGSALAPGKDGLALGVQLRTFPLTPPPVNLIGKVEGTSYIPVLPEVQVGFSGGKEGLHWRTGFGIVPPLSVKGASASVVGVDGGVAWDVGPTLRVGGELAFTLGQALAPVTAAKDQDPAALANSESTQVRFIEICQEMEYGCIDTLTFRHLDLRAGATYLKWEKVQPWAKLGALLLDETFAVQVDLSTWRLRGVLPEGAVGAAVTVGEGVRLGVGASAAFRPDSLSDRGPGLFYRFEGGLAWVF